MTATPRTHGSLRHLVLEPSSGWRMLDIGELYRYRDLLRFLVWRDIKGKYAQTVLGFGWAILRPLFSMIVFTVVFGKLARVPSDGIPYPIFSFCAMVPWTYFSASLTGATTSLIAGQKLITKVYFPRMVVPLTPVFAALVDFVLAMGMLAILMVPFKIIPTGNIVFLPLLVLLMVMSASGLGMWLSALAIQYRDIRYAMQFVNQLLMYAAPVVWPASLIVERFPKWGGSVRLIYGLYPMAGVIEGFRAAVLGKTSMPWDLIGMGALSAVVVFVTGAFYFRRMERFFADVA